MRQSFDDYYNNLSPVERRALQMLSIIYEPVSKVTLSKCFRVYQTIDKAAMDLNHTALGVILTNFKKLKILNKNLQCHAGIVELMTRKAIEEGHFDALVLAVRDVLPNENQQQFFSDVRCMREIRIMLYQQNATEAETLVINSEEAFPEYFALHDPYLEVYNTPFDAAWLLTQSDVIKEKSLANIFSACHIQLRPAKELVQCCDKLSGVFHDLVLRHQLLSLTYSAETKIPGAESDSILAWENAAWWQYLQQNYTQAEKYFRKAEQGIKRSIGKKKVMFDEITNVMYLLTLLKQRDQSAAKKLCDVADFILRQHHVHPQMPVLALKAAACIQLNKTPEANMIVDTLLEKPQTPWECVFYALIHYWLGRQINHHMLDRLKRVFKEAHRYHYWWLAYLAAELLMKLTDEPVYAKFFDKIQVTYDLSGLLSCIEQSPDWQRQLDALVTVVNEQTAEKENIDRRLVWFFDPKEKQITAREQKRQEHGEWSRGRNIALSRLHDGDEKLTYLTDQDKRVCRAIERSYDYYGAAHYIINAPHALRELAGHPHIYLDGEEQVSITLMRSVPSVVISEENNAYSIRLSEKANDDALCLVEETPTRFRFVEMTPEQRKIAAVIGEGLHVPKQAKQKLLDSLGALSGLVTVQSDITGKQEASKLVTADFRLVVQLWPFGEGFKCALFVKPFTHDAPYFKPGRDGATVFTTLKGKRQQTTRDLAAEIKNASEMMQQCPSFSDLQDLKDEKLFATPEACLAALAELQALPSEKLLIEWPEGEKLKIVKQLDVPQLQLQVSHVGNWFQFDGDVQIDEEKVIKLQKLVRLFKQGNEKFITLDGKQVYWLTERFRQHLSTIASTLDDSGDGLRLHPLHMETMTPVCEAVSAFETDHAWQSQWEKLKESQSISIQLPAQLNATLRSYQLAGFEWLVRLAHWGAGACLADDMGLGKTLQTITLLLHRAADGPALVIAPTSVCLNWQAELAKFSPSLHVQTFSGRGRYEILKKMGANDVLLCSYGLLQQEGERLAELTWNTIILDEAQAIKNAGTKRSRAAHSLKANFKAITTGTPIENNLGELWNLFQFINPNLLGTQAKFNARFAHPIERQQDEEARIALKKCISPFILRRTKSQVLTELPPRTEVVMHVEMSEEEASFYEALRREALQKIMDSEQPLEKKRMQVLAEIMRLRQACCHPSLVDSKSNISSSKVRCFEETIKKLLMDGHKVLVFSQFVGFLKILKQCLDEQGVHYQYLDGATPIPDRQQAINAFQSGDGDVFLISLKAGGVGLNLTAADYVLHMDPWWNPAVEDQASDRAHRMGQQKPVTVTRFIVEHGIEEKILALHAQKRDLASTLLSDTHQVAKLGVDELLHLIQDV